MNEYVKPNIEILDIETEQSILYDSILDISYDDADSYYDQL